MMARKFAAPLKERAVSSICCDWKLTSCCLFGSDDESLEGLQQEIDDCKNDKVQLLAPAAFVASVNW